MDTSYITSIISQKFSPIWVLDLQKLQLTRKANLFGWPLKKYFHSNFHLEDKNFSTQRWTYEFLFYLALLRKKTFKVTSGTFSWEQKNYFILQSNEASSKDLQMKKSRLGVDRLHEADTQKNCFCFDLKWVNLKWKLFSQNILSNFSAPQTTMPLQRSCPGRCITLKNPNQNYTLRWSIVRRPYSI